MKSFKNSISAIKYLIIALAVILLVWLLPAFYELLTPRTDKMPFVVYSCLDSTFIRFETNENKQVQYIDFKGREFTKSEADSLLPLFAFRQLVAEGRLPDSLYGVALTPKMIQQNSFHFKTSLKQLNKPAVGLYTMIESASGQVDLQLPQDVFRLTDEGLEFIDCETNTVNRAKSLSFSRELTKQGFKFPVHLIWGNGTTRKEYDNGFLLTDAEEHLFQLKMVKGMPWVRKIKDNGKNGCYRRIFTIEPANRQLIGLAVSSDDRLWAIRSDATMQRIGDFHMPMSASAKEEMVNSITIVGDLFHWTITLYTTTDTRYYAVDARTFEQIACEIVPDPAEPLSRRLMRYLLPIRLRFTSWHSQLIYPNINDD